MSFVPTLPRVPMYIGRRFGGAGVGPTHLTSCRPSMEFRPGGPHHEMSVGIGTDDRRLSTMSVYAFSGGIAQGRCDRAWSNVATVFPAPLCSVDISTATHVKGFNVFEQLVVLCALLTSLASKLPENCIVGGWSIGSYSVYLLTSFLERLNGGIGMLFTLDDRARIPFQLVVGNRDAVPLAISSRLRFHGVMTHLHCFAYRSCLTCVEFLAPSTTLLQQDSAITDRRLLCSSNAHAHIFSESDHYSLGWDHAWDIARRVRIR